VLNVSKNVIRCPIKCEWVTLKSNELNLDFFSKRLFQTDCVVFFLKSTNILQGWWWWSLVISLLFIGFFLVEVKSWKSSFVCTLEKDLIDPLTLVWSSLPFEAVDVSKHKEKSFWVWMKPPYHFESRWSNSFNDQYQSHHNILSSKVRFKTIHRTKKQSVFWWEKNEPKHPQT